MRVGAYLIAEQVMGGDEMEGKTLFLLFTDTGTWLSKIIRYYTKHPFSHVSISLDPELKEMYSFGRKQANHPFRAGFVREDTKSELFRRSACEICSYQVDETDYQKITQQIKGMEATKHMYKYNFIGLIGFILHIEMKRKKAFFCSQFVATVLQQSKQFQFGKRACFVTPADIRNYQGMRVIYRGKLEDYLSEEHTFESVPEQKQSRLFLLLNKFKKNKKTPRVGT